MMLTNAQIHRDMMEDAPKYPQLPYDDALEYVRQWPTRNGGVFTVRCEPSGEGIRECAAKFKRNRSYRSSGFNPKPNGSLRRMTTAGAKRAVQAFIDDGDDANAAALADVMGI